MSIGVGILGFAHGHVNAYCTQWQKRPEFDIKVTAGWDHDATRLETANQSFGIQSCQSEDELLARGDVQAVVIAAETSLHADLVEKAAAAGKTIVLQKPLALTMAQADRIVEAVNRAGVPFSLAWQMRVDPQNLKMKEIIQSGALGKICMVRRRHGLTLHNQPSFLELWHVKPELNRDIWADDSSHPPDFIYWLLGKPETVTAEITTQFEPRLINNNGMAIFHYPGGPLAEVTCSFTCLATENSTEVFGEKGSIIQNYGDVPSCNVPRPAGARGLKWYLDERRDWVYSDIPTPSAQWERIEALSGPLADFLHGRRAPIATAEEGRTVLRMVLATYLANEEGRRVSIDDPRITG
jgi:predicted dehydrogenase